MLALIFISVSFVAVFLTSIVANRRVCWENHKLRTLLVVAMATSACATLEPPAHIRITDGKREFDLPLSDSLPRTCSTKDLWVTQDGVVWLCIEGVWYRIGTLWAIMDN